MDVETDKTNCDRCEYWEDQCRRLSILLREYKAEIGRINGKINFHKYHADRWAIKFEDAEERLEAKEKEIDKLKKKLREKTKLKG